MYNDCSGMLRWCGDDDDDDDVVVVVVDGRLPM